MRKPWALLVVALAYWATQAAAPEEAAQLARGRGLFEGTVPLHGTIVGHAQALPAQASRCINCHGAGSAIPPRSVPGGVAEQQATSATSFGPALTAESLKAAAPRRGGPPSRYDSKTFCELLRTGIDPAQVMVRRSMPRYDITDADCQALWRHLSET